MDLDDLEFTHSDSTEIRFDQTDPHVGHYSVHTTQAIFDGVIFRVSLGRLTSELGQFPPNMVDQVRRMLGEEAIRNMITSMGADRILAHREQTPQPDVRRRVLRDIARDAKADAQRFDGRPFDGVTVGAYLGAQAAAIASLARVVESMLPAEPSPVGCPDCGTILNAETAKCAGAWHADNRGCDHRSLSDS